MLDQLNIETYKMNMTEAHSRLSKVHAIMQELMAKGPREVSVGDLMLITELNKRLKAVVKNL